MRKNNSGITLVSLVITIIVLLILASITVYSGLGTVRSARLTKFTTELKMMQQKVNELYDSYTNNKAVTVNGTEYVGTDIQKIGQAPEGIFNTNRLEEIFSEDGSGITDRTGYMYYDTETIQALGLEDMEYEFFVNVAKRSVVSIEGFNDYGKRYYTLEQVPDGVYNVEYNPTTEKPTFDVQYEYLDDDQWRITISNIQYNGNIKKWNVKYQIDGKDYWAISEDLSFVVNEKGVYHIYIENGNIKSATKSVNIKGINKPELSEGMIPIKWDEDQSNWIICSEDDGEWYDYIDQPVGTDQMSKWANIMLSDGRYYAENSSNVNTTNKEVAKVGQVVEQADLGSMFVWIPRYAYQIERGYHTGDAGKINIIFLTGTKEYKTGSSIDYISQGITQKAVLTNTSGEGNWNEHPAFNYGGTIVSGIWVAKFEASSNTPNVTNGGGNVTSLKVKVLPGVPSWRFITIGNSYTNCINMNNSENASYYGIEADDDVIDPHLFKDSEWGAVAYLAHSSYGRNGNEITINNSTQMITGSVGGRISASGDEGTIEDYTKAGLASTTGNVTGIYDMSGGAYERVAGYVNNGNSALTNGDALVNSTLTRHKDVYVAYNSGGNVITSGTDSMLKNYEEGMKKIFGNAIWETSSQYERANSWYKDQSSMASEVYPFIYRGGGPWDTIYAGIFNFNRTTGRAESLDSYRPSIVVY